MELATKYSPEAVESRWYEYWMKHRLFHSEPDHRPAYTIVIPPPNVTGVLHMGHMLNNSIQDILVRRARMRGFNTCWVPSMEISTFIVYSLAPTMVLNSLLLLLFQPVLEKVYL